jgi:uncharacterized membrane protein
MKMGLGIAILGALGVLAGLAAVSGGTYIVDRDLEEKQGRRHAKGGAAALLIIGIIITLVGGGALTYQAVSATLAAGAAGELT